jgi:hypothetical protein
MKKYFLAFLLSFNSLLVQSNFVNAFSLYNVVKNKSIKEQINNKWNSNPWLLKHALSHINCYIPRRNERISFDVDDNKLLLSKGKDIYVVIPINMYYYTWDKNILVKKYADIAVKYDIKFKNNASFDKILEYISSDNNKNLDFTVEGPGLFIYKDKKNIFEILKNMENFIIENNFGKNYDELFFEKDWDEIFRKNMNPNYGILNIVRKNKDGHIQKFGYDSNNNKISLVYDSDNTLINIVKKWFTSSKKNLPDYTNEEEKQKLKQA